jgi:hypothetical protein
LDEISQREAEFKPRQRFSFKSKRNPATVHSPQPSTPRKGGLTGTTTSDLSRPTIHGIRNEIFVQPPNNTDDGSMDISIQDCEDCVLDLRHVHVSALHLHQLRRCLVLSMPLQGSAFLSQLESCTLVIACHQVRYRRYYLIVFGLTHHVVSNA